MQTAARLPREKSCLQAERHYRVLDTPREDVFDRITELAAHLFDVPMVALGFADCDRIWFKSTYGLDVRQVLRDSDLFSRAMETEGVFQVSDLRLDGAVTERRLPGDPEWRFLAGIAVRCPDGKAFGGLWLIDERPRRLDAGEEISLRHLAAMVVEMLELRRRSRREPVRYVAEMERDGATGLPDRSAFIDRLGQSLERSRLRADVSFAVLLLDIDRFKVVNGSLGRGPGNRLLAAVAERLRGCLRPGDMAARLGGDEFAVLLASVRDLRVATRVADRIQRAISEPVELDGGEVVPSVSVGIALGREDYGRPDDVLRDAEIAMYRAKVGGRARHVVFAPDMHAHAVARLRIESELRHAVRQQQLELHYQPLVELASGRLVGLEALLRWRHPSRGLLAPADFLEVAEETGLIVPIGSWVLREACRQAREWNRLAGAAPLIVSVNLAVSQLQEDGLPAEVARVLASADLAPALLWLETTESSLLEDPRHTAEVLSRLRNLGLRLCLDDFGTGYSSMGYLAQLPVDVLKIDRCFVRHLDAAENREIVRSVLTLARRLDLSVVVEGVETVEQLSELERLGCDYVQGYLLAPPLPPPAVDELLAIGGSLKPAGTA